MKKRRPNGQFANKHRADRPLGWRISAFLKRRRQAKIERLISSGVGLPGYKGRPDMRSHEVHKGSIFTSVR